MSWLQQGQKVAEFKPEPKKSSGKAMNGFPFFLKKGEEARIAILNADDEPAPVIHCHSVLDPSTGNYERVVCALPEDDYCHFCEYATTVPEGSAWKWAVKKYACFTILDLRESLDKEGKPYPPQRKLRLTQDGQLQTLQKVYHAIENDYEHIESLQYALLKVSRSDDPKSANIGDSVFPLKMLDITQYSPELLQPFTEEEILSYFVLKGSEKYNELVEAYPIKEAVSTTVKRKKV